MRSVLDRETQKTALGRGFDPRLVQETINRPRTCNSVVRVRVLWCVFFFLPLSISFALKGVKQSLTLSTLSQVLVNQWPEWGPYAGQSFCLLSISLDIEESETVTNSYSQSEIDLGFKRQKRKLQETKNKMVIVKTKQMYHCNMIFMKGSVEFTILGIGREAQFVASEVQKRVSSNNRRCRVLQCGQPAQLARLTHNTALIGINPEYSCISSIARTLIRHAALACKYSQGTAANYNLPSRSSKLIV